MSTEKEDEESNHSQKRDSVEAASSDQEKTSSDKPKPVEGRIPKRQKKLPEDDPVVVQARKALEMFQELEAEDIPKFGDDKTEAKIMSSPTGPKIHHRIPIISQQEELLL